MTRTARRKAYYFLGVGLGALVLAWAIIELHFNVAQIVVLVVVLLLPGRVLGFFWRDQLSGLRLLRERKFEASAQHSRRFLETLAQRPWMRHMIWLGSGTYSRDPWSLALNNLGAAEISLGDMDNAKQHLEQSREADPENPLPYLNLGRLYLIAGEPARANEFLLKARSLGYSWKLSDKLIRATQARFAYTDGPSVS